MSKRSSNPLGLSVTDAGTGRLEFLRAINALSTSQAAFVRAVDGVSTFKAESLADLDRQLDAKRKDLEAASEELQVSNKRQKLQLDLDFEAYGRDRAIDVLKKTKEVPIKTADLEALQESIRSIEQRMKDAHEKEVRVLLDKHKSECENNEKLWKLELATRSAELKANLNSAHTTLQNREADIKQLHDQITQLSNLVKEVAEASSKTVTQNFAGAKKC